jgi:hypothetical protein
MTKKEAVEFCVKNSRKSKIRVLFSVITAGLAIGNLYKNAYNMGVFDTGKTDIEDTVNDDQDIALSINGKEV